MERHPEHDAVSSTVRSWYSASTPEIGMSVTPTSYGFLAESDRAERKRLVLTVESPQEVLDALAAASEYYGTSSFTVWVDHRSRAERLTAALGSAGRRSRCRFSARRPKTSIDRVADERVVVLRNEPVHPTL